MNEKKIYPIKPVGPYSTVHDLYPIAEAFAPVGDQKPGWHVASVVYHLNEKGEVDTIAEGKVYCTGEEQFQARIAPVECDPADSFSFGTGDFTIEFGVPVRNARPSADVDPGKGWKEMQITRTPGTISVAMQTMNDAGEQVLRRVVLNREGTAILSVKDEPLSGVRA